MDIEATPPSTQRAVLTGLAGLAAAMGIGRFAFTPLLPLMQADGLTLSHAAWLAGANYLGYLIGALACAALNPRPTRAARHGLLAVTATTLAMGWPSTPFALALLWRFGAGVASAFVLVGLSAWALAALSASGRASAAGGVYAGVGIGMFAAGLAAMGVALAGHDAGTGWWLLGAIAAAVTASTWRTLRSSPVDAPAAARPSRATSHARLVVCYGAFGFGYILPATFLPAMARAAVDNPAVFGWTWPVFGLAAALSTLAAGPWLRRVPARTLWAGSQVVMAFGVLVSGLASQHLAALVIGAACVGGTFMVATMAGLQEARRVAGAAAPRLMASMTAAFGAGQFIGPLTVGAVAPTGSSLVWQSGLAAALLLASSAALMWPRAAEPPRSPARTELP